MSGLNPIHPPSALLTQLWLEPCSWPWQHGIDRWVYVWPATLLGCNEMMGSQGFSMTKSSKFRQPANHSFWNLPKHMYSYLLDQPTKIKECSPPKPLPVPKCCQNKLISSRPSHLHRISLLSRKLQRTHPNHKDLLKNHLPKLPIITDGLLMAWNPLVSPGGFNRSPVAHARSPQPG